MGIVVDTSILIEVERKRLDGSFLTKYGDLHISSITVAELLFGVNRTTDDAVRIKRSNYVSSLLSAVIITPYDETIAQIHATVGAKLSLNGLTISTADLIIAATALRLNLPVLTLNVKDFEKVDQLEIITVGD